MTSSTFGQRRTTMLSKGGKISHRCSACESTRIVNTKKGLGIQSVEAYVTIPANSFFCLDCFGYAPWSSRIKSKDTTSDNFNGDMSIEDWESAVAAVDKIHRYRKLSKFYKETTSVDEVPQHYGGQEPTIHPGELTQIGVTWSPDGEADYSQWTHRPDDFGVWVGYNSWRFKDPYDVMLKDGTIHKCCSPNASSFMSHDDGTNISEYDVIAVKLCTYDDLKDTWMAAGETEEESNEYRATRNASMFGAGEGVTPSDWKHVVPKLFDIETKQLVTVKIKNSGIYGASSNVTMEEAHELFSKENFQKYADELPEKSDEELLAEYFPNYDPKIAIAVGRGNTRAVIHMDDDAYQCMIDPSLPKPNYTDPE